MKNNKLIKVKNGIFSRIFKKIKLFFFKNTKIQEIKEEKAETIKADIKKKLKVNIEPDTTYHKEQFMKEISKNPDLLKNFSIERLERIKEYYKNSIKEKEQILANMKKSGGVQN